ncbi:hypothetical protein F8388_026453, partial [Cannabis sativa]
SLSKLSALHGPTCRDLQLGRGSRLLVLRRQSGALGTTNNWTELNVMEMNLIWSASQGITSSFHMILRWSGVYMNVPPEQRRRTCLSGQSRGDVSVYDEDTGLVDVIRLKDQ